MKLIGLTIYTVGACYPTPYLLTSDMTNINSVEEISHQLDNFHHPYYSHE